MTAARHLLRQSDAGQSVWSWQMGDNENRVQWGRRVAHCMKSSPRCSVAFSSEAHGSPNMINLRPQAIWFPSKEFLATCLSWPSFDLLLRGRDCLQASVGGASSDLCALTFSS